MTNPDAVESGKEKPRLVQCGPYVYQEIWEKRNVTFLDDETVSYIPITTLHFVPEMSNGSLSDNINFINVPALVSWHIILNEYIGNTKSKSFKGIGQLCIGPVVGRCCHLCGRERNVFPFKDQGVWREDSERAHNWI